MTGPEPDRLVVGRLRKAHGLKGECTVFPLTSDPHAVFVPGVALWLVDLGGGVVAGPVTIARSRPYHREWLLTFRGHERREAVEPWRGLLLAAPREVLTPPASGEVYLHELEGFAAVTPEGAPAGLVTALYDTPAGLLLEIQGPVREMLVPFRKEFVTAVDRQARRLTVEWPAEAE